MSDNRPKLLSFQAIFGLRRKPLQPHRTSRSVLQQIVTLLAAFRQCIS